jgi:3-phenylpropionate/trans-cinnamate dioxygenase ferredoxin reductase subunit
MDGTEVEITDVRDAGPDTIALRLASPLGFDARPGQFVQVRATVDGERVTRHYSVSSADVGETFELTVGIDPEGTLTPWLARAEPGDTVEVDGPFGRVFYEDEDRVAVLAAGPGIGAAVGVAEAALARDGEAALVYRSDELVHEDRLARLAAAGARVYVVSGDDAFGAAVAEAVGRRQVFVYGFAPFVGTAEAAVRAGGGDPASAKVENFG